MMLIAVQTILSVVETVLLMPAGSETVRRSNFRTIYL